MPVKTPPFWEEKSLQQMTADEWESLCDGCARCCMLKFEDRLTLQIHYTRIACRLLDTETCRCEDYSRRCEKVADCVRVHALMEDEFEWLPQSCAYRRLHEGRALPDWHPLISGSPDSVRAAGISMRGRCISEKYVHPSQIEEQLIEFDDIK